MFKDAALTGSADVKSQNSRMPHDFRYKISSTKNCFFLTISCFDTPNGTFRSERCGLCRELDYMVLEAAVALHAAGIGTDMMVRILHVKDGSTTEFR
jgi:hypothetical protein